MHGHELDVFGDGGKSKRKRKRKEEGLIEEECMDKGAERKYIFTSATSFLSKKARVLR
jgi:hypothetical protein